MSSISTTPALLDLLHAGSPVAFGVSGGKDSTALVLAGTEYLDRIAHRGPRVLIHSDLGRVEWEQSLPQCERLAEKVSLELITVRRAAGGMMERWLTRWSNNVARYANLECVKLILPWSTPSMRFCTSELKTAIICRALVQRFPGQTIISAAGIRADESPNRAKAAIVKPQEKLRSVTHATTGVDWLPIHSWTIDDVWAIHERFDFPRHEAYQTNSRVSCKFCILANEADLLGTTQWLESHDLYREMVDLEVRSTFSFQDSHWLGDVAPHLLSPEARRGLREAKQRARRRGEFESKIPPHLLYTKGWPTCMPTVDEARLLCEVRCAVGQLLELDVQYTRVADLCERYADLMALRPTPVSTSAFRQELMVL